MTTSHLFGKELCVSFVKVYHFVWMLLLFGKELLVPFTMRALSTFSPFVCMLLYSLVLRIGCRT